MSEVEMAGTALGSDDFVDLVRPFWVAMGVLAGRLASDADRDDVVQEALLAAWRKSGQFDPERGSLRSWLLAIVADQAAKARRRRRRASETLDLVSRSHVDRQVDVDLERALSRLTDRQRLAVTLYYFLDLPVSEVAAVMGCAQGTVKATLSQARHELRHVLGEDYR